jgi:transketolase
MVSKYAPINKRKCIICDKEYQPTNGRSKTCSKKCWSKRKRQYDKKYIKEHPEISRKSSKNWQNNNRERVNEIARERNKKDKRVQIRNQSSEILRKKGISKYGKCELCGILSNRQIHHIKYTKEDFILICEKCHQKIHYGI